MVDLHLLNANGLNMTVIIHSTVVSSIHNQHGL